MDIFFVCMEIIGIVAFAVSGAVTAMRHCMDLFGICMLGVTTAVGGGIIRDILLGIIPASALADPTDTAIACATALLVFLPPVRRLLFRNRRSVDRILLVADSAGLAAFTAHGFRVAVAAGYADSFFFSVFVAVLTGVGGGVLRDLFAGERPYIFVKHIYAIASIAGALLCAVLYRYVHLGIAALSAFAAVFVIRLLSAALHLKLPRAYLPDEAASARQESAAPAAPPHDFSLLK